MVPDDRTGPVIPYKDRLDRDRSWAWDEAGRHFCENSAVFKTMRNLVARLDALGVSYAVAGDLAMFKHGLRRVATEMHILVNPTARRVIAGNLLRDGYVPAAPGSRHLRDAEHGVTIKILVAGEYPGDGRPKPVTYPDPDEAGVEIDGVRYLQIARWIESKLASGMSDTGRMVDLADAIELMKAIRTPASLADDLDPSVRPKYLEFWEALQRPPQGPDIDVWPEDPGTAR